MKKMGSAVVVEPEEKKDVTLAALDMAERAFRQRDELCAALSGLCDFLDQATQYELEHPSEYNAYTKARNLLATMAGK